MALNHTSTTSSPLQKRSVSPSTITTSHLSEMAQAVAQADARKVGSQPTPVLTPALSLSSSTTSSSEDAVLYEDEYDGNDDGLSLPATPPTSEQFFSAVHTEFGHCSNQKYRHTSQYIPGTEVKSQEEQDPPYYILFSTYISYLLMIILGHIRDFAGKRLRASNYKHLKHHDGYAPLNSDFDSFYTRRFKARMDDCFSNPATGVAGRTIVLLDRASEAKMAPQQLTGTTTRLLNISSYNYLGFAQARGGCADAVEECIRQYGVSTCGARLEGGSSDLHTIGEALVARFMGTEDALISSMGFATNSTIIPALVSKGCLVISDELNHASIRFGTRLSGAVVRTFKHNDMASLESLLREVISQGQPKTHRPWKKILLIVEGLYSMEGTLVNLPAILALKKKYKFHVFVDEAHSVGALGPHGRGVVDYFGIDPRTVDILMGTFTKSFGAAGGYIAGSKAIIDHLRVHGHSSPYAEAMTPPVLTQVISSMASIMGLSPSPNDSSSTVRSHITAKDEEYPGLAPTSSIPGWMALSPSLRDGSEGKERLRRLAFNSRYLSRGLIKLGFITYGHVDSPIVPLLIYNPGKMGMFHRLMKQRATPVIVVVVGYPATPLVTSRVRFCVSASHTKEDMDTVLTACDEIGDLLDLKHGHGERWSLEEIKRRAVELVQMDL